MWRLSFSSFYLRPVSFELLLTVPRMALALSAKAFSVSAPSVWNSLSYNCRSSELLSTVKLSLKTELFDVAYCKREHSASGLFLVCSSTQKCSSKEICAVLLSKMCNWQLDNISLENSGNFFSFKINIPGNSNLLYNRQIINQFGVSVSFILGLAHPVDASWLLVRKCKILFNIRNNVQ